jgi:hypothetical protein
LLLKNPPDFTALLQVPFWETATAVNIRLKDEPDSEVALSTSLVGVLARVVNLRHELIHNPSRAKKQLTDAEWDELHSVAALVLASDWLIIDFMSKHLKPEVESPVPPPVVGGVAEVIPCPSV